MILICPWCGKDSGLEQPLITKDPPEGPHPCRACNQPVSFWVDTIEITDRSGWTDRDDIWILERVT